MLSIRPLNTTTIYLKIWGKDLFEKENAQRAVRSRFVERILQFLNSLKKSERGVVCASAGNHA